MAEIDNLNEIIVQYKLQDHNINDHYNQKFLSDNKIRVLESDLRKCREEKQKYEIDFKILNEKHTDFLKVYNEMDKEYNFLKNKQSEEILMFEERLEKALKDLEILQRENLHLRTTEGRYKQDITKMENQRDNFRDKYHDLKVKNNKMTTKMMEVNKN